MAQVTQLFVIAGRYNQSVRLNHDVYPSVEAAKAELDRWEKEEDPDHDRREAFKKSSYQSKPFGRKNPHPCHNDGTFEVVDLATYIQNTAVQNYEKARRDHDIYRGAYNTTQSHVEKLDLLKAS
jgi:hypothetical protein